MKLAAISDIHGNIAALEAVLADIQRRNVTDTVNLGDSLSGPFDASATAERLMALDLRTVRGNHDRQLFDRPVAEMLLWETWAIGNLNEKHLAWVKSFPLTDSMGEVFLCHATPEQDDQNWLDHRGPDNRMISRDLEEIEVYLAGVTAPVILCGHTHTPRVVRLPSGHLIVNPGSVGCPAYLDIRMEPNFIHQTGAPDARYAILDNTNGQWQVEQISVPYDARGMAKLAHDKGAESWAKAVTTGWFA